MKNKKKIIKFGLIASPVLVVGTSISIYYYIKSRNDHESPSNSDLTKRLITKNKANGVMDNLKIFPKLSSYDFYKYIRIKNGEPIINDKLIAAVINKVIKDMKYTTGTVHWSVDKETDKKLKLTFAWVSNSGIQKPIKKVYELKLDK